MQMLRNIKDLEDFTVTAADGPMGRAKDFYFDDSAWVIRYLVLQTGGWLTRRRVMISPISIGTPDWGQKVLSVTITKDQVMKSPDIDADGPMSPQHETDYHAHYGYPYYWRGGSLWGQSTNPSGHIPGYEGFGSDEATRSAAHNAYAIREEARRRDDGTHLRSCKAFTGYHVHATDGEIGHIDGFLVDDQTWSIAYLVIKTSNWWLGHKVLIAPRWIQEVRWFDSMVSVNVTRQQVRDSPPYDWAAPLERHQEMKLYKHYGQPGGWADAPILETDIIRI
jgi:hypothetical protein